MCETTQPLGRQSCLVYLGSYEKGGFPLVWLDGQSWGTGGSLKSAALRKDRKKGEKHQYFVLLLP